MVELPRLVWDEILAAMVAAAPLEGCGLLVGRPGQDRVESFIPVTNALASPVAYRLDDEEYLRVVLSVEARAREIVGVVHSHPTTEAYPSAVDVDSARAALTPAEWHWVIVSLAGPQPVVRSFRLDATTVLEERVVVADRAGTDKARAVDQAGDGEVRDR